MKTATRSPKKCVRRLNLIRHKVAVCAGSACMRHGGGQAMREIAGLLQTRDDSMPSHGKVLLEAIPCSGNCRMAPLVIADNALLSGSDLLSIRALVA